LGTCRRRLCGGVSRFGLFGLDRRVHNQTEFLGILGFLGFAEILKSLGTRLFALKRQFLRSLRLLLLTFRLYDCLLGLTR
jgi:hypothetical protein